MISELSKEHPSKFGRSVHLVKFFDALLRLLEDCNQKIQIEALSVLKVDLRPAVKVGCSEQAVQERTLSRLVECLFRLVANNNAQIKHLAAECILNLRDYEDKSKPRSPEIVRSTLNRQYINLSIKTKASFAKFLLGTCCSPDNAQRIDEPTLSFVHPILTFNVRNASSELKRLNELLFRQIVAAHGGSLSLVFDAQTLEQIFEVAGADLPGGDSRLEVIN